MTSHEALPPRPASWRLLDADEDDWASYLAEPAQPGEQSPRTPDSQDAIPQAPWRSRAPVSEADFMGLGDVAAASVAWDGPAEEPDSDAWGITTLDRDLLGFESWVEETSLDTQSAGMRNVGNTCFMACGLQCLANVPGLRDLFLSGRYEAAKSEQPEHARGSTEGGVRLAEGFAALMGQLWNGHAANRGVCPRSFKKLVESADDRFAGCAQHDAMEFLEFLLDRLREDCNTVVGRCPHAERRESAGRPDQEVALEAARHLLAGSDSEIDELFLGMFKSTTTCPRPECGHRSVVFDPFLSVKVPVLGDGDSCREVWLNVTVVPHCPAGSPVRLRCFRVRDDATVGDLLDVAAVDAGDVRVDNLQLAEIFMSRVYNWFSRSDPISDICESDVLVAYELREPEVPAPLAQAPEMPAPPARQLMSGDLVVTSAPFRSNNKMSALLPKGLAGRVTRVDELGDAYIRFDDIDKGQWVTKKNRQLLQVVLRADSEECREDPDTGAIFTPAEFVEAFREDYSCAELGRYWKDEMVPIPVGAGPAGDEAAEESVHRGFQKVILHFAGASAQEASGPRKLFGFPLVAFAPESSDACGIEAALDAELSRRFGAAAALEVAGERPLLFHAGSSCELPRTRTLLGEALEGREASDARHGGPLLVVAQWDRESDAPPELRGHLEQLTECAMIQQEVDLEACLEQIAAPERLEEGDSVRCSGCDSMCRATKQLELWTAPPVLMLQLKRFEYVDYCRQKIGAPVRFPLEGLDLADQCRSPMGHTFPPSQCVHAGCQVEVHGLAEEAVAHLNGATGRVSHRRADRSEFCIILDGGDERVLVPSENVKLVESEMAAAEPPAALYDLAAACVHMGTAAFGHYVAYVRSCEDGAWRLYNDDDVVEVDEDEVADEKSGAYVLFYVRRDRRPPAWGAPAEADA